MIGREMTLLERLRYQTSGQPKAALELEAAAEIDRLTVAVADAYRLGQEDMRERAAIICKAEKDQHHARSQTLYDEGNYVGATRHDAFRREARTLENAIRALPAKEQP